MTPNACNPLWIASESFPRLAPPKSLGGAGPIPKALVSDPPLRWPTIALTPATFKRQSRRIEISNENVTEPDVEIGNRGVGHSSANATQYKRGDLIYCVPTRIALSGLC